jgi:hypothetical protein
VAVRTCPICGTSFIARSRQLYDRRGCGEKAARMRRTEERLATRAERYKRHLRLGGSSTPLL